MRTKLFTYLDTAITVLLLFVVGLTPLLFLNTTTEFYETPKLIFLIFSTLVLLGLWIFSWIVRGKIVITRTPLDWPLLILLVVVLLSTWFSLTKYTAIFGNFPRVHGSAVAWVTYILLYFVTVSHLKSLPRIKSFLYVLYGSAVVTTVITLLSFFHVFFPTDFAQAVNFTPTGSPFSTIAFLLMLLPLPLLSIINPNKYMPRPFAIVLAAVFGITVVLIGSIPTSIALLIAVALSFFVSKPAEARKALPLYFIPVVLIVATFVLAYAPLQLPSGLNQLQKMEANFPKEIQLPFGVSWKVSASAFRDAPFIGTGPASYIFNFTSYKPAEFNTLPFWNFSFDTAYNEFLQVLGTLGIFGFAGFVSLCVVVLVKGWRNLSSETPDALHDNTHVLLPALAISGILSIVLLAIHATTLVSTVVTFFVLAAFMASKKSVRDHVMELSMGLKATTAGNKQFDLFPVIVFILFLVGGVYVGYMTINATTADYYHRQALAQANKSGTLTYEYLQKAESLNPLVDLYRVDMAQTNFALANAIAAKKGPTKDNPKGSLTDQDKKTIQTLLSQAINESRASVALSPRSSRNWEVLAAIYRNITGVANNALAFSLDAYGRAIQRDPLNPALRVNVGGIHYSVKNYDLAIRFYSDAINLKPDYANAYFNLAIALRDKGDVLNGALVAQQLVNILQKDTSTPDYKVAVKLLDDLKSKAADKNKENQNAAANEPKIATGSAALQNPNLPSVNVSNLNNPPKTTTPPAAVKQNPNANIPQLAKPTSAPAKSTTTK